MRSHLEEGIIIKRSNFGETDRIITFFSHRLGKLSLLAKGVRRSTSHRSGALELFNYVRASVIDTRGELGLVTEVQVVDSFTSWRKHLGRVNLAYQLCEIIDKITPDHQPHPELFDILVKDLSQISDLSDHWEPRFKAWLVEIVKVLGYWPEGQAMPGDVYKFIEDVASRPLHSPKLLDRLKNSSAGVQSKQKR